jgi:hypothetical protein
MLQHGAKQRNKNRLLWNSHHSEKKKLALSEAQRDTCSAKQGGKNGILSPESEK